MKPKPNLDQIPIVCLLEQEKRKGRTGFFSDNYEIYEFLIY
jgi:hypothetical protein